MSRYIATRAIRGANALVTEAELMLGKALNERGPETQLSFPNTAYYLPTILGMTGKKVEKIADLNPVLRGWAQYFRTGNAANHFTQVDAYVEARLRGLLRKRAGSRLPRGRAEAWRRPFYEALGLIRLRGTIQYPGSAHATT